MDNSPEYVYSFLPFCAHTKVTEGKSGKRGELAPLYDVLNSASSHEGIKRAGWAVISVPDAERTFNLLMLLLTTVFSMATIKLQWEETEGKIKNIHVIHIRTYINPAKLLDSVMVF